MPEPGGPGGHGGPVGGPGMGGGFGGPGMGGAGMGMGGAYGGRFGVLGNNPYNQVAPDRVLPPHTPTQQVATSSGNFWVDFTMHFTRARTNMKISSVRQGRGKGIVNGLAVSLFGRNKLETMNVIIASAQKDFEKKSKGASAERKAELLRACRKRKWSAALEYYDWLYAKGNIGIVERNECLKNFANSIGVVYKTQEELNQGRGRSR